jgi:hypothetical protein
MKASTEKLFTVRQKDADRKRAGMHIRIPVAERIIIKRHILLHIYWDDLLQ